MYIVTLGVHNNLWDWGRAVKTFSFFEEALLLLHTQWRCTLTITYNPRYQYQYHINYITKRNEIFFESEFLIVFLILYMARAKYDLAISSLFLLRPFCFLSYLPMFLAHFVIIILLHLPSYLSIHHLFFQLLHKKCLQVVIRLIVFCTCIELHSVVWVAVPLGTQENSKV